jgi:hypothetical protein
MAPDTSSMLAHVQAALRAEAVGALELVGPLSDPAARAAGAEAGLRDIARRMADGELARACRRLTRAAQNARRDGREPSGSLVALALRSGGDVPGLDAEMAEAAQTLASVFRLHCAVTMLRVVPELEGATMQERVAAAMVALDRVLSLELRVGGTERGGVRGR